MTAAATNGLTERDMTVAQIEACLAGAERDGSGSTLVLDGLAGLGKSALLDLAARTARSRGFRVLRARGDELGRNVPHGVLQQLLGRVALEDRPGDDATTTTSSTRSLLAAIGVEAIDAPITPGQVATGMWWLLDSIIDRTGAPVLVVVDDLHLADGASMDALAFLATRIDAMSCVLLVAQRSGEPCDNEPAAARLRHAAASRTETLTLLTPAGAANVARSIDPTLGDDDVDAAYRATGGNPFLLTEHVRHLDAAVPPRVVDHVRIHLDRGDARLADIGAAIAALGPWATVARVAAVAGFPVDDTERLIDELVDSGIMSRTSSRFGFRHPLLRTAMLEATVDDPARRDLAVRAADALDDDAAETTSVASLLLDAPIAGDPRTSSRLVAGAAASLGAGAPNEARRFLERALAEPIADEHARRDAWMLVVRACGDLRDTSGSIRAMHAALELTSDPYDRSDLRTAIANAHISASNPGGAMTEFAEAAREIEHLPGAASRVVMLRASGQSFGRFLGIAGDGDDHLSEAVPSDPSEDTHDNRIVLANVAMAHLFANDNSRRAIEIARRSLAGMTLLDEEGIDSPVLYAATAVLTWTDDYDIVLPVLDEAVAQARRRGSVLGHATASACRGSTLWRRGDLVHAAADLETAIEARRDGWSSYLPFSGYCVVKSYRELGDDETALRLVRASVPPGDHAAWGPIEAFAHATLGLEQLIRGDDEAALQLFLTAVEAGERQGARPIAFADWRHDAVELAARLERADEVRELAATTLETARRWGGQRPLGLALRAMAAITEEAEARRALLDESISAFEAAGVRLELARTLLRRGEFERAHGDDASATALLERSRELATACGSRVLIAELAQLGVSSSTTMHEVLTPGEMQVVELAVSGLSNRDIAQSLFVTVKAVEWHLTNSYRKLGVSGRRDLARALAVSARER